MLTEKPMSKTAIERQEKEVEMFKIVKALENAGMAVERVNDFGTLAYMIPAGQLEGRFITVKVVLTKEFNEETLAGFEMAESIREYEMKVENRAEAKAKAEAKELAKQAKKEKKTS